MSINRKKTLFFDLILITPILIVAVVLLVLSMTDSKQGSYVVVEIEGQFVARYSLQKEGEYDLNNGTNTLVIQNGYARIIDANCPDKTCEKQGKINLQGQTIVCLPNRLMVTIEEEQGGIDLVI